MGYDQFGRTVQSTFIRPTSCYGLSDVGLKQLEKLIMHFWFTRVTFHQKGVEENHNGNVNGNVAKEKI